MASLKDRFTKAARGESSLGFDPLANDEARLATLRIEEIEPDPNQPRQDMGDLEGLMASIRQHGIMQPLIVSPLDETHYRLIAGERRFTAATQLGLRTVPALIRTVADHHRLELQLIENLHRKDLDAFEEARGYQRLLEEFNLTHEEVAQQVGKSRSHITQMLAVNRIPEPIQAECQEAGASRETLFLIAKQEDPERMRPVLNAALHGAPVEEQRAIARKGQPRPQGDPFAERKPKQAFRTSHHATVIVQSLSESITQQQVVAALEEALQQARGERGE